ncbi:MAG: LysR family transcriptional regulator [Betaproteobacteria bacterium]|nr:LysR family transcriptional regulator [Betaproteobacteria bacterium]
MSQLRLSLRQLQIFIAVVEHGSTSAAAEAIALSQSATSAALNELERTLGMSLFDRVSKRLLINHNGRTLLPQALSLLDAASGIERWAEDEQLQTDGLRIGASTTIGNYLLPDILAKFRATLPERIQPGWQAQVIIENTAAISQKLVNFELDIGLIEGYCHESELMVRPWLEDELVVVAAPHDPVMPKADESCVSIDTLRHAVWLLREPGSGTRENINEALLPYLHHLQRGVEFGDSEAIKRATAKGLGISCLSRFVVSDMLEDGRLSLVPTPLPKFTRRFYIVLHKQKKLTRGLSRMLDYFQQIDNAG